MNHQIMLHMVLITTLVLLSCSTPVQTSPSLRPEITPALPDVTLLDDLRGSSAPAEAQFNLTEPLASSLVSHLENVAIFNSAESTLAYAVYAMTPESTDLLALEIGVMGNFWVMLPDYDAGTWQLAGPELTDGHTYDLTGYSDLISPASTFYCAIACYGEPQPMGNLLTNLELHYDIPLPAPVTYHVEIPGNGGSDLNPGTAALPWATLQHAADHVGPGDTVIVGAGDFAGFHLQQSGVTSHPITFDGQGSARIVSDNENTPDGINIEDWGSGSIHHVTIRGFTITGATRAGIRFSGNETEHAHHITIADNVCDLNGRWGIFCGFNDDITVTGNECSRSGVEHGIYLSNSCKRYIARYNTCWGNNGCGIHNNGDLDAGGDGIMEYGYVEFNTCYDNGAGGGSALNFDTARNCYIRGNLCYNNHASGISLYSVSGLGSRDNCVINNTVLQPGDGRWCINIQGTTTGTRIYNNILLSEHSFRGSIDITSASFTGLESDFNIVMERFVVDDGAVLSLAQWQTQSGQDAGSFTALPADLFANPGTDDYHITASCPAHDAGVMTGIEFSPMPSIDLDGDYRPAGTAMDIGYDEIP